MPAQGPGHSSQGTDLTGTVHWLNHSTEMWLYSNSIHCCGLNVSPQILCYKLNLQIVTGLGKGAKQMTIRSCEYGGSIELPMGLCI